MLRLRAMTCGWLEGALGSFLEGESGRIRVPVPSYLVEHPKGRLLFDTGLHLDLQTDAPGRLGALANIFDVEFGPGQELAARLQSLDVDPSGVDVLVNSHLHFDHSGGNSQIPNARLLVQRREWEAGLDPDRAQANFFDPRDYDLGHDLHLVDGEHDVFGDGSVVCVPTHGHTPGHQSLRLRLPAGDVVLAGDACYLRRTLETLHLPPVFHDRDQALDSLHRLRALQARGARIFFGHDPELWSALAETWVG
jgi:glyoxylase-like metal-dependent hydrolase (beta-lactamase superfamily II)